MHTLQIKLLGKTHLAVGGMPLALALQKARGLLIYLAVEPPHAFSREKIAALLWPEQPPEKAAHNLRQALSDLRRALSDLELDQEPMLLADRETITLSPHARLELDVRTFEEITTSVFHARSAPASRIDIRKLKKAGALYTGPFLQDFELRDSEPFQEWSLFRRESIHRQAIRVYENLLSYYQQRNEESQLLQTAEILLELAPWDEQTRQLLMIQYARAGQQRTALAVYHAGRKFLRETLDLEPSAESSALFEQLRGRTTSALPGMQAPTLPGSLPAESTPFIGREKQLDELCSLLARADVRLVTVLGPGGIGKTRLATQLAREMAGLYKDGVFVIPLDSVDSEEQFFPLLARHLEIQPFKDQPLQERVFQVLQQKDLLLVLDNAEHLQHCGELASQLLRRTHRVQLIVTSRKRLNIQEEWTCAPGSLALPPEGAGWQAVAESEAAALFLENCARSGYARACDQASLDSIAAICVLVEGFPLGIELAAAAVRSRSLEQIREQIAENLGSVTAAVSNLPPRHRSLRATFEHSWQLLDDESRQALRRLAVFHGSFRPPFATTLAAASQETLDHLLASSLLSHDGERFSFHPLVHQFALEKLQQHPAELRELQHRYAAAYAAMMSESRQQLQSLLRSTTLAELLKEEKNLTAAWKWSLESADPDLLRQSMHGLFLYFFSQSRHPEGLKLFTLPSGFPSGPAFDNLRGWFLIFQAAFSHALGLNEEAARILEQAEILFHQAGSTSDQAACSVRQAEVSIDLGQYDRAIERCRRAVPVFEQEKDAWWMAFTTFQLGDALFKKGEIDAAQSALEQSLLSARCSEDPGRLSASLNTLGDLLCFKGDLEQAENTFRECLKISRALQDQYKAAVHLNNLGTVLHMQEQWEEASRNYLESLELCRRFGDRYGEVIALSNLGEIAMENQDYDLAGSRFRQAYSISAEISNTWSMLTCLANLAELSIRRSEFQEACTHLRLALHTALETETMIMLPELLLLHARMDIELDRSEQAASLLAGIINTMNVEDWIRQQAEDLAQKYQLVFPESVYPDLKAAAEKLFHDLDDQRSRSAPAP